MCVSVGLALHNEDTIDGLFGMLLMHRDGLYLILLGSSGNQGLEVRSMGTMRVLPCGIYIGSKSVTATGSCVM